MNVDGFLASLKENQKQLIEQLKEGKYKPNPVRRIEIPKETKGGFRKLECNSGRLSVPTGSYTGAVSNL